MIQRWQPLGLVRPLPRVPESGFTHAMTPFAHRSQRGLDLYFSPRDERGRSHIARARLAVNGDSVESTGGAEILLAPGTLGAFDDAGTIMSWLLTVGERDYLYYIGWTLGRSVPFRAFIGLATSQDGGASFQRHSDAPVFDRSASEPYLTTSPCVLYDNGTWRMWYASGRKWTAGPEGPRHYYHIRYAESKNGIAWQPSGIVCIDFQSPNEYAIARPSVIHRNGLYHMWYCCRGENYRIGYAVSKDGLAWQRRDEDVVLPSEPAGWDVEMQCYPFVFEEGNATFMLYNGNGYGRTGIGAARMSVL